MTHNQFTALRRGIRALHDISYRIDLRSGNLNFTAAEHTALQRVIASAEKALEHLEGA